MINSLFRSKEVVDPNFLVIGAQKCATSWLKHNIEQHPDVLTPVKDELHFFSNRTNYSKGIEWYRSQFIGYSGQIAIGESTPNYFWTSEDAREIKKYDLNRDIPKLVKKQYPNIKLILSLRNPVERALSAYYHHIRKGRVHPNSRILDVGDRYGIISMGFYDIHLKKWFECFDPDSFLILIFEENIAANHEETLKKVYEFIGVNSFFKPKEASKKIHTNKSNFYTHLSHYAPHYLAKYLQEILPSTWREADFWKISIADSEIEELRKIYEKHNQELSSLLGRRIRAWEV